MLALEDVSIRVQGILDDKRCRSDEKRLGWSVTYEVLDDMGESGDISCCDTMAY
jgi:hypothetical protein